ncbi:helix-turn-helix domain-containing protein [Methylobacterium soli]|uniref:Helix-turn-helix domain-containing protein n=2 Tax=Methylobacterium soli TaxID=553447 RepID=A0A6L3STL1_9HYPH|nr:helix-turn-helix domain-containing protein [Methylobacterium soli]
MHYPQEPPLTRTQAAQRTGIAPATLAKLAISGGGPPMIKLGRSVRYRSSDLEQWLASRIVASTTEAQARGLHRISGRLSSA